MIQDNTPAIEIKDLRVDYGHFIAVHDLCLTVPTGEIIGLVGPNGAGKTSTFRVLATLMEPTYGEIRISGIDILLHPRQVRRIMGYMPDLAPVPSDIKVWEFLDLFAQAYDLGSSAKRRDLIDESLAEVALKDKRNSFCKTLSRGQTQRLVLAKTLLHQPKVLILDEPASGMDPLSRRNLKLALRKLASQGTTVIVSSHILSELSEVCSSLCVMNQGKLLASGTVEHVRATLGRAKRQLVFTILERADEAARWIDSQPHTEAATALNNRLTFDYEGTQDQQAALITNLIHQGFRLAAAEELKSTFEDILVEVAESNQTL